MWEVRTAEVAGKGVNNGERYEYVDWLTRKYIERGKRRAVTERLCNGNSRNSRLMKEHFRRGRLDGNVSGEW